MLGADVRKFVDEIFTADSDPDLTPVRDIFRFDFIKSKAEDAGEGTLFVLLKDFLGDVSFKLERGGGMDNAGMEDIVEAATKRGEADGEAVADKCPLRDFNVTTLDSSLLK